MKIHNRTFRMHFSNSLSQRGLAQQTEIPLDSMNQQWKFVPLSVCDETMPLICWIFICKKKVLSIIHGDIIYEHNVKETDFFWVKWDEWIFITFRSGISIEQGRTQFADRKIQDFYFIFFVQKKGKTFFPSRI